jgi:hypothetical protein
MKAYNAVSRIRPPIWPSRVVRSPEARNTNVICPNILPEGPLNRTGCCAYKEPFVLPKGTRVDVTISYNNSAANPHNPSNPPRRVLWGEQSLDEMGGVGLMVTALRAADEAVLAGSSRKVPAALSPTPCGTAP